MRQNGHDEVALVVDGESACHSCLSGVFFGGARLSNSCWLYVVLDTFLLYLRTLLLSLLSCVAFLYVHRSCLCACVSVLPVCSCVLV
jgi:hypothetical protein